MGWQSRFDETFSRYSTFLQPINTHTIPKKKPQKKKKKPQEVDEWVSLDENGRVLASGLVDDSGNPLAETSKAPEGGMETLGPGTVPP
ncbi:unnamed protein product, partial [Discosporangium mesarthrocarpum]